jgi:hypothetical protein
VTHGDPSCAGVCLQVQAREHHRYIRFVSFGGIAEHQAGQEHTVHAAAESETCQQERRASGVR